MGGGFAASPGFAGGFGGGQGRTAGPVSPSGETVVRVGRKVGRPSAWVFFMAFPIV